MSIVPLRFRDWWDDWEHQSSLAPFSRTSRLLDQQFGLGLRRDDLLSSFLKPTPSVLRSGYIRPWDSQALNRLDSGSTLNIDREKFQVSSARVSQNTLKSGSTSSDISMLPHICGYLYTHSHTHTHTQHRRHRAYK